MKCQCSGVPWWVSELIIRHCHCCGEGSTLALELPCDMDIAKKKKKKKSVLSMAMAPLAALYGLDDRATGRPLGPNRHTDTRLDQYYSSL